MQEPRIIEPVDMLGRPLDIGDSVAYPIGGSSASMCVGQIETITHYKSSRSCYVDGKWVLEPVLDWKARLKPLVFTGHRDVTDHGVDEKGEYTFTPKPNGAKSVTITKVRNFVKVDLEIKTPNKA
jgi:hypothetical protein